MMINSFNFKVTRFKESTFILINQINQRKQCSSVIANENKNDKFKQLIKDGPSLGDFIRSTNHSIDRLKLKRADDEPRFVSISQLIISFKSIFISILD